MSVRKVEFYRHTVGAEELASLELAHPRAQRQKVRAHRFFE